jgi:hypothetical protein
MANPTFFARGDSSKANNASLNAQGTNKTPVAQLEFQSQTGDFVLEYNGGLPDPDTTVLVDGVPMGFTVEFSGDLPDTNKLSDVNGEDLRGEPITVITTEDGQRYFFLTGAPVSAATMNAFPNGAHPIANLDTTTDILICFAGGTLIDTPDGERRVEALKAGDLILNNLGRAVPLIWVARRTLSAAELEQAPQFRPICIPRNAFGHRRPHSDLYVSPQHRVLVRSWRNTLHFGEPEVLVPAKYLVGETARQACPDGGVTYYHLLLEDHDIVLSNGLETESYQPSLPALNGLAAEARLDFFAEIPKFWRRRLCRRSDAFYSVKSYEARLLAAARAA